MKDDSIELIENHEDRRRRMRANDEIRNIDAESDAVMQTYQRMIRRMMKHRRKKIILIYIMRNPKISRAKDDNNIEGVIRYIELVLRT